MAIELKFLKQDKVPWGFRLTGGSDYNQPLTVLKVIYLSQLRGVSIVFRRLEIQIREKSMLLRLEPTQF